MFFEIIRGCIERTTLSNSKRRGRGWKKTRYDVALLLIQNDLLGDRKLPLPLRPTQEQDFGRECKKLYPWNRLSNQRSAL